MANYFPKINSSLPFKPLQPNHFPHQNLFTLTLLSKNNNTKLLSPMLRCTTGVEKQKEDESDSLQLAQRWREIHGEGEWKDLLDPMDHLLRKELIRYGEMAQTCYEALDQEPHSKYFGSSIYRESEFFNQLGLKNLGYDVTRFLYLAPPDQLRGLFHMPIWPDFVLENDKANWMGYVAVSNDEMSKRLGRRDITIAWRGTIVPLEWVNNLKDILTSTSDKIISPDTTVKIQAGFLDLYTNKDKNCEYCKDSASEQVVTEVTRLIEKYSTENLSISITGHSLGSALAIINAYDIAEREVKIRPNGPRIPITVFSFAGPRVGNDSFKNRLKLLGVKVLRVFNDKDIVTHVPGVLLNETRPDVIMRRLCHLPWSYKHVGTELALDHRNSPFLKWKINTFSRAHDMEVYLHLVDGYHGKDNKFELATGRDYALVNKYTDFLDNRKYRVPPRWKQDENKGMARDGEGRWVQPERFRNDIRYAEKHSHQHHSQKKPNFIVNFVFLFGTSIIIYFMSIIAKKIWGIIMK